MKEILNTESKRQEYKLNAKIISDLIYFKLKYGVEFKRQFTNFVIAPTSGSSDYKVELVPYLRKNKYKFITQSEFPGANVEDINYSMVFHGEALMLCYYPPLFTQILLSKDLFDFLEIEHLDSEAQKHHRETCGVVSQIQSDLPFTSNINDIVIDYYTFFPRQILKLQPVAELTKPQHKESSICTIS